MQNAMGTEFVLVTTTTDDAEEAAWLAQTLVSGRLAACAHIQQVDTVRWRDGDVVSYPEWHVTFKTSADRALILQAAILGTHSSDYPSLIVTPIIDGSPSYFAWLAEQTAPRS